MFHSRRDFLAVLPQEPPRCLTGASVLNLEEFSKVISFIARLLAINHQLHVAVSDPLQMYLKRYPTIFTAAATSTLMWAQNLFRRYML